MSSSQNAAKQALHDHLTKGLPYADEDQIEQVMGLLTGEVEPDSIEGTASWIRQCFHRPSGEELLYHALTETLDCHGVEQVIEGTVRVCTGNDANNEPIYEDHDAGISFEYLNVGEGTIPTLIFSGNSVYVAACNDMVECLEQEVADDITGTDWSKESFTNPNPMPTDIQPLIEAAMPAPVSAVSHDHDLDVTHSPGPSF
jgi:hypothetical protein